MYYVRMLIIWVWNPCTSEYINIREYSSTLFLVHIYVCIYRFVDISIFILWMYILIIIIIYDDQPCTGNMLYSVFQKVLGPGLIASWIRDGTGPCLPFMFLHLVHPVYNKNKSHEPCYSQHFFFFQFNIPFLIIKKCETLLLQVAQC